MDEGNNEITVYKAKDVLKMISKVILFNAIGILILCIISPIFSAKWYGKYGGVSRKIKGMYNEPENTIDIVMIGNSDMYNGVSTMKLWKDMGVTSYHIGTPVQTTWTAYYLLKDFFKTQKPKLALIDVDFVFEKENKKEEHVRQAVDPMKFSKNKLDLINDPVYNNSLNEKISYIFPFFRYHTRWSELSKKDIEEGFGVYEVPFKGYEISKTVKSYAKKSKPKIEGKVSEIPANSKEYLDKILDLCKQNNIDIIFVYVPTLYSWTEEKHEIFSNYANEKNIKFVDYNLTDFNWKKNTKDKGRHLNIYGAEIITEKIEKEIINYNFVNHKDDETYSKWNEYYNLYESIKKQKNK